ncbi:MAG: hypothetical protein QOE45_3431 [Frankiaceae bacterium]|jgi:hypothetical protein|nr:hypothetical protein [Frankiaceae bacterium]
MRSFRTFGLAVAAFAVAATLSPAAQASTSPGTFCKLWWPHKPSVTDNGNGTYTVDPGERPQWVC